MSENNEDTHNGENFTAFTSPNYVSPVPELGQVGHETSTGERESVLEKLRDPNYLPSSQDIFLAFGRNLGRKFQEFCFDDEHPVYEFLNSEHLTALSDYFALRSSDLGATSEKPLIILEVGAGNGRLSHFLREKLGEDEKGLVEVIATDANVSKDTNPYGISPVFPVEHITTDEALRQFNPDIVICSWMPYRADWTPVFRATKSVKEYVLLGETDGGCVGSDETWGVPPYDDDWNPIKGYIPLYEQDGFDLEYLDASKHQICRTDFVGYISHSSTVSFKRLTETKK